MTSRYAGRALAAVTLLSALAACSIGGQAASTTGAGESTGGPSGSGGSTGAASSSANGSSSAGTTGAETSSGGGTTSAGTTGGVGTTGGTTGGDVCGEGNLQGPFSAAPAVALMLPGPMIVVADSLESACHYAGDVAGNNPLSPSGVALVLQPVSGMVGTYRIGADAGPVATASLYQWSSGPGTTQSAIAGTVSLTPKTTLQGGSFMLNFPMGVVEVGNFGAETGCPCP